MATPYTAGLYYEYKCVNQLRAAGYGAQRTAGSHGPFDVIAWKPHEILLIQVKKVGDTASVDRALAAALKEWARSQQPPECCVHIETWVYSFRHVDKFTH